MTELMDLHVDLMINIFLRLDAKPLLQFKSVCKSWYYLISSPNFAELHLDQTLAQSNPNVRFVFSAPHLSSAEFDTFDRVKELDNPFRDQGFAHVVGSCHGLLCLCNYDLHLTILLYNPTTQTYRKLPFLSKPSSLSHRYSFGFGYEKESKDYKFVRILQSNEGTGPFKSQVMVYSLKTDSWVRAPDVPSPFFSYREDGVLVNGTLHWVHEFVHKDEKRYSILGFGLGNNSFNEVPQPKFEEQFINLRVGVLDRCLCLTVNDLDYSDIWVLKEYGVVESWTRLYKVKQSQQLMFLEWPIAYSLDRQKLFLQLNTWRVVSLDLQTMVVKDVKVCDFPRCFDTQVCIENLIMLKNSGSEALDQQQEKKKRRRRRRRHMHQRRNISVDENLHENVES
ncbi:F-box protein CPR1 [Spinacia oleracea]|uniref:F-box protein CPR1 n=1 Tax=Spinacia oleracea TaxID=3562 RepID=A0A9R0JJP4_SPIOL|nr:F-box protein CPR1-like [Spinacia oleracea]